MSSRSSSKPQKQDRDKKRDRDRKTTDDKHRSSSSKRSAPAEDPRTALWQRIKVLDIDAAVERYDELPISQLTLAGLKAASFVAPTSIQCAAIPAALRGRDVIGVAKTGSGKTLAFLVPLLERLWHLRITRDDSLAAIVLSPTRELASQTFNVLRRIGIKHGFSAGLVTGGHGGKQLENEKANIGRVNILVGTPGRVLQHLDESANVSGDTVRLLIIDEVDRMVADGFEDVISGIVDHLPPPPARQTLVFSATQPREEDGALARLELASDPPPHVAAPHSAAASVTPLGLSHAFCVVPLPAKFGMLFSFLRSHLHKKIIVFFSSGHLVRYAFAVVGRMLQKYGTASTALTGKMPQKRRQAMTDAFRHQTEGILFTTDLAARGLDFPGVQWVIQFDPAETVKQYLHRVGRTARLGTGGAAITFLTPQQQLFAAHLAAARVQCAEVAVKQDAHALSVTGWRAMAASLLIQQPQLRDCAVKAFVSTFKAAYHHPLRSVGAIVDPGALPAEATEGASAGILKGVVATPADINAVWRACAPEESLLPSASEYMSMWSLTRAEVVGYAASLGLPSAPSLRHAVSKSAFDRNANRDMLPKAKKGDAPKARTGDADDAFDLLEGSSTDEDSDAAASGSESDDDAGKGAAAGGKADVTGDSKMDKDSRGSKDRDGKDKKKDKTDTTESKAKAPAGALLAGGLFQRQAAADSGEILHMGPSRRATKRMLGKQFNKSGHDAHARSGMVEFASSDSDADRDDLGKEFGTAKRFRAADAAEQVQARVAATADFVKSRDADDKERQAERVREKKQEKKRRLTGKGAEVEEEGGAVLG